MMRPIVAISWVALRKEMPSGKYTGNQNQINTKSARPIICAGPAPPEAGVPEPVFPGKPFATHEFQHRREGFSQYGPSNGRRSACGRLLGVQLPSLNSKLHSLEDDPDRSFTRLRREFADLRTRQDRPRFIASRFRPYLSGSVLDVGCDVAVLRQFIEPELYAGVGLSPEADVKMDLEQGGRLPFDDHAWDTVVCLDVLEHLDNLHQLFDEIIRVARNHVIVSFPNNWGSARRCSIQILDLMALEKPRPILNRAWRTLFFPTKRRYLNRYSHTVVCVYGIHFA
jgi:hypothetical protein